MDLIYRTAPRACAVIVRSLNANVVVMEAHVHAGRLESVEAYWLLLEQAYRKPHATTHREELSRLDQWAYGFHTHSVSPTEMQLTLNQHKNTVITLRLESDGSVNAYATVHGEFCMLHHVYVEVKKTLLGLLPVVERVHCVGRTRDHRELRQQIYGG